MSILCIICARGGSKGVKNKNIRNLFGKPLIAYTIEIAQKWGKFDNILVSTDSMEIKEMAENYGADVPFLRPSEISSDTAGKVDVWKHAVLFLESRGTHPEIIIDLDVTSPLRTVEDIEGAYQKLIREELDMVFSVCKARKNPYFNMVELSGSGHPHLCKEVEKDILSRQTAPQVYELNASVYVFKRSILQTAKTVFVDNAGIYEMPQERSVDIDTEFDFSFVEYVMQKGKFSRM